MPVRPELFNQELIAPAGQNAEDWNSFTEDQRFHHAHSLKGKLFSALGIDLDAPNPGKDKNGNLVLFELGENGEMRDPLADTPADSKEFLKKIYDGKIYAIPAGQENPVQIQLKLETDRFTFKRSGNIQFSKPINASVVKKPDRPNFWARFRHFFGFAKKEYAEYDRAMLKYRNLTGESLKEKRKGLLEQETADLANKEQERREKRALQTKQDRLENLARDPKSFRTKLDGYMQEMLNIYGPEPVKIDDYVGEKYTNAQFDTLKPYKLDAMKNEHGTVSKEEFMGLSMLGALTAESADELRRSPNETLTRDEHVGAINTFFTSDLYGYSGKPRPGAGDYFAKAQAPGRDKAAEALMAYKNGDKGPLAELIGKGMRFFGEHMDHNRLDHSATTVCNAAIAEVLNLLDRDDELKQKAIEAGMRPEDMELAMADRKLFEICRENEWAQERLKAAEKGEIDLTDEEKKACIDARLKYETLRQAIGLEVHKKENSEEYKQEGRRFEQSQAPLQAEKVAHQKKKDMPNLTEQECRELGAEGAELERKGDGINNEHAVRAKKIVGIPEMYRKIGIAEAKGKTDEALDKLVRENLPGCEALESLSLKDLNKALSPNVLFDKNSPYTKPPQAAENMPQKQPEKTVKTEKDYQKEQPAEEAQYPSL